jgi:hypothetical protein
LQYFFLRSHIQPPSMPTTPTPTTASDRPTSVSSNSYDIPSTVQTKALLNLLKKPSAPGDEQSTEELQQALLNCKGCVQAIERDIIRKERSQTNVTTPIDTEEPPSLSELGKAGWTLIHTVASAYPSQPDIQEKKNASRFFLSLAQLYPCHSCAEDFQRFVLRSPPRVESQDELTQWTCELHNHVNRKLGKDEFDCSKFQDRWGDWSEF